MGLNYLRKIDTFGVPIDLCFEKKKVHKTSWGGFWTMIIFLFSLSVFIILGLEIVFRQKPNVIAIEQLERSIDDTSNTSTDDSNTNTNQSQYEEVSSKSRATYSSSGLIVAFAALDESLNLIDNWFDSFKITGYIIDQRGFKIVNQHKLSEFEQCSKIDLLQQSNNKKLFKEFDIKNLICLQNSEELDHYLTGEMGSEVYNHIKIQVSYKEPLDDSLKQKLKYVGIFFTDQMMDVQNYSVPLTKYRKNIIQKVSTDKQYQILIRNQHAQIMTDSGLIWSDYQSQNFFSFKDYKVSIDSQEEKTLLIIQTETDPKLLVYNVIFNYFTFSGFLQQLILPLFS